MIDRYYQEELRFLTEAAKEFAQAHPEQARLLNIDSVSDRDPYVERLFEGFAFLTARVREKQDDDFPEFIRFLFESLAPHYLRPVPSLSILEFRPRSGMLHAARVIPAGTPMLSVPVGQNRVRCQFRTCYPVALYPISLQSVVSERGLQGQPVVRFRLALDSGIEFAKLNLQHLRFYVHADAAAAYQLHLLFTQYVDAVIAPPGGVHLGDQRCVTPAGFAEEECVLPERRATHPAYLLLQEYFSFREKFLFFTVGGLQRIELQKDAREFELHFVLKRPLPDNLRISADNFRLFSTPIINLFPHDAEPMHVDHSRTRYRIAANAQSREDYAVYAVDEVKSTESGTGRRHTYVLYHEFETGNGPDGVPYRTFTWYSETGPTGTWDTYLSLHGIPVDDQNPVSENLSISARCTNGSIPRDLNENDIRIPSEDSSPAAAFGNLTKPTQPLLPPNQLFHLWRLLSHLSHNHSTLAHAKHLQEILTLYDWSGADVNRRRISGIHSLSAKPGSWLIDGAFLRGVSVVLELQESCFHGPGDAHLFGMVLREFFQRYVTINSLVELTVNLLPSQETFHWPPETGTRPLL